MGGLIFDPAREMLEKIVKFVSIGIVALLVILIGWIVSKAVRSLTSKMLKAVNIDKLSERSGLAKYLYKGDVRYELSDLIALIIYWLLMMVVIMVTANVVGLTTVDELMDKIILYIPNVIVALFILVLGASSAIFLRKLVETTAKNAGLTHARSLGVLTHTVMIVFAVFIALGQLKIGITILAQVITIVLGSLGLAFALAFGLGCRDIAGKIMQEFLEKSKAKK